MSVSGPGQREFDHLVQELVQQGYDWHDAVDETLATFVDSNLNVSGLFIYRSKEEWDAKQKSDTRIGILEKCAQGTETFVNASFAMQGLTQTIRNGGPNSQGTLTLLEKRKLFKTLFKILLNLAKYDDDSDSDEEEDDDDEIVLQKSRILEFSLFLLQQDPANFSNFKDMLSLSDEEVSGLKVLLENHADDSRYVNLLSIVAFATTFKKILTFFVTITVLNDRLSDLTLDLLRVLMQVDHNSDMMRQVGILQELDLIKKMHKKSESIQAKSISCSLLLQ
jgi:hypothetical protein